MKERILELKQQGKTLKEISEILNCAISTVHYHCDPKQREYYGERRRANRKKQRTDLKSEHGGKCSVCGYNRCLQALDFHHLNPKEKTDGISNLFKNKGKAAANAEAKKCILICRNCHSELHSGLISI